MQIKKKKYESLLAVMSRGNSVERARMMTALGADVILVDQLPGSEPGQVSGGDLAEVERKAQRITAERKSISQKKVIGCTRKRSPV